MAGPRYAPTTCPSTSRGAAFGDDGSLLLGLRFPTAADGRPLLVELDGIQRLFEPGGGVPEVRGFWMLDAVGRDGTMAGVRDLALHDGELHVVTGNIDAREKGSVLLEDYPRVFTPWPPTGAARCPAAAAPAT